jgi:hypothetical protein
MGTNLERRDAVDKAADDGVRVELIEERLSSRHSPRQPRQSTAAGPKTPDAGRTCAFESLPTMANWNEMASGP